MKLEIIVRSIVGEGRVEWTETVHSWRRAWAVVDSAFADRGDCRKFRVGGNYSDVWCLDIKSARRGA